MTYKPTQPTRAFTLLELLATLAVIAILTGILLPVLASSQKAALKTQTTLQLENYLIALQSYQKKYGPLPHPLNTAHITPINLKDHNNLFIQTLEKAGYTFHDSEFTDNTLTTASDNPNIFLATAPPGQHHIHPINKRGHIALYTTENPPITVCH